MSPCRSGRATEGCSRLDASTRTARGRVWIGTVRQGVYVVDPKEHGTPASIGERRAQPLLPMEGVHAITEVRPGEIWLGTDGHGIVSVNTKTFETRRILHDPTVMSSLADDSVQALHTDRSGLVWIATTRSISRYNSRQAAIYTVFGGSSRPGHAVGFGRGLGAGRCPTGASGWAWAATASTYSIRWACAWRPCVPIRNIRRPRLPKDYVNALVRGPSGDVYVGTEQGLYRADKLAHGVVRLSVAPT